MITKLSDCTDHITGGPLEAELCTHYKQIVQNRAEDYVMINMNIKRFLYINAEHGRKSGNDTLRQLYEITRTLMREDEFIARCYADDFYLLLRYSDMAPMLQAFLFPLIDVVFDHEDPVFYHNIYLSFGIYFLKDGAFDYETAKDMAALVRKGCEHIGNRTFSYEYYRPDLFKKFMDYNEMADRVTRARFENAFVPYVQPKIDLKTQKIVGGEILLRWFDEEGKEVPLYSFLPTLNEHGDIYLVDLNIFEQVCCYLDRCLKEQRNIVPLSFNVTNTSLFSDEFLEDYLNILEKYKIPVHYIEFEFMENIQFDRYNRVKEIIDQFHHYGFTCSLDDFGSGYSSFNILLEHRIDVLKIDQMFFRSALNEERRSVIHHIIEIAHSLDVKVLAEGVETKDTIDYLMKMGCDMVQGYYYYKPMPLDAFEKLLDEQNKQTL